MTDSLTLRTRAQDWDFTFIGDLPYVYHCHHYNLFHDQTIDDALGEDVGNAMRAGASQSVNHELLRRLALGLEAETASERVEIAQGLFSAMGQGTLSVHAGERDGRAALGETLHYGTAWKEKYGARVRRSHPVDSFAAGFASATTDFVNLDARGRTSMRETKCVALRDAVCEFERVEGAEKVGVGEVIVDRAAYDEFFGASFRGIDEERIRTIGTGLQDFLLSVRGDERGLVQAFNVYVTMQLAAYYSLGIYETVHQVEKVAASSLNAAEALFREAGHVCVFNTFGNILLSPEWEGMVGPLTDDPEDIASFCCAIARGLGFGHWAIGELDVGKRFVLRTSTNYESAFYRSHYGTNDRCRCYILQGAAQAIMMLAERVDWLSKPELTQEFYDSLFRSEELPWRVEETQCVARGDELCEAVATKTS